jgi:hypothetical protein
LRVLNASLGLPGFRYGRRFSDFDGLNHEGGVASV